MKATKAVECVVVTEGDHQVASQVGLHLLGDLADRAGLTSAYSVAVPWTGERSPGQDRGRLLAQVAVTLAGGGVCIGDMAALRDQPDLFGEVASSPTIWRALHEVNDKVLVALRGARATARAKVREAFGAPEETILDIDATPGRDPLGQQGVGGGVVPRQALVTTAGTTATSGTSRRGPTRPWRQVGWRNCMPSFTRWWRPSGVYNRST